MQAKFLRQIVEQVAGEPAVKIVDLLSDKKDVNEFIIAKKLGLTINQTRNLLYRLSHLGILSSIRKKDKRKGWYIYFWTLNVLKSLEILEEKIKADIAALESEFADKKSKRFYRCKICGIEVTEELALLHDFVCPGCGEVYELSDNEVHVKAVTKKISRLKKEMGYIENERMKEQLKQGKKLKRKIKRAEKEKHDERKKKAQLRKIAKKREATIARKKKEKSSRERKIRRNRAKRNLKKTSGKKSRKRKK